MMECRAFTSVSASLLNHITLRAEQLMILPSPWGLALCWQASPRSLSCLPFLSLLLMRAFPTSIPYKAFVNRGSGSRFHRTSHHFAPFDCGVMRSLHSRCPQGPSTVCIRHAVNVAAPWIRHSIPTPLQRGPAAHPRTDWWHRCTRRNGPRQRHDPQD